MNKAIAAGDPELCLAADSELHDRCFSGVAEKLKDVTVCDRITKEEDADSCREGVGIAARDLSICASITTERTKERCITGVADAKFCS